MSRYLSLIMVASLLVGSSYVWAESPYCEQPKLVGFRAVKDISLRSDGAIAALGDDGLLLIFNADRELFSAVAVGQVAGLEWGQEGELLLLYEDGPRVAPLDFPALREPLDADSGGGSGDISELESWLSLPAQLPVLSLAGSSGAVDIISTSGRWSLDMAGVELSTSWSDSELPLLDADQLGRAFALIERGGTTWLAKRAGLNSAFEPIIELSDTGAALTVLPLEDWIVVGGDGRRVAWRRGRLDGLWAGEPTFDERCGGRALSWQRVLPLAATFQLSGVFCSDDFMAMAERGLESPNLALAVDLQRALRSSLALQHSGTMVLEAGGESDCVPTLKVYESGVVLATAEGIWSSDELGVLLVTDTERGVLLADSAALGWLRLPGWVPLEISNF